MTNYSTTTYVGLLNTLRYKKQLIHSTKYLWFVIKITVHMCFTAREQAVRRRRPASYSSHSVDRRLWRHILFPLQPRGARIWQQTDTNVYEDGFLVEKVQQLIHVQPTMVGSAVETRVPNCQPSTSLFVRAGCLNADHAEGGHTVLSSQVRWT